MKDSIKKSLRKKCLEMADWLSQPKTNYPNFVFEIYKIVPTSEYTALAYFIKKGNGGKKALAFFYYSEWHNRWNGFIVKESHAYGMVKITKHLDWVENDNFNR